MINFRNLKWCFVALLWMCSPALGHVSEQGIVLLLPTGIYTATGCLAVVASIVIVSLLKHHTVRSIFLPIRFGWIAKQYPKPPQGLQNAVSIASLVFILALVILGVVGTRDPLANLLPLTIWTIWWIALVMLHSLCGNLWSWLNPWTGIYNLIFSQDEEKPSLQLPAALGCWPAIGIFILFYMFIIADIAPSDPARLANAVLGYVIFTFTGMVIFGSSAWLRQCESFTIFFRFAACFSPLGISKDRQTLLIGLPGWKALQTPPLSFTQAIFVLSMLASGSFDGVNETFWWLAQIGINPLEFPGRSAVIVESVLGMLVANIVLFIIFAFCIWLGLLLAKTASGEQADHLGKIGFKQTFCTTAISLLPIALVYHGSHYLVALLVNGQYFIAALSDPFSNGANYLNLNNYQVTTGFLNTKASVQQIWLSQAGLIVFGHIIAVLMAHSMIVDIAKNAKQAFLFHAPIAIFMTAYTWFGLWLLASPKGA